MKAVPFSPEQMSATWDTAVRAARNATFLFERGYMDYHQDRFEDASLLFQDEGGQTLGLLPANIHHHEHRICAHGGLTYGDLLLAPQATLTDARDMLKAAAIAYMQKDIHELTIKPVPYIYHRYPADDSLYWLFRAGARLTARTASTAIDLQNASLRRQLWHRKTKKGATAGLTLHEGGTSRLQAFWAIVEWVLATRHATRPVHTFDEMALLMARFPDNVRLFTVDNPTGEVITGCIAFVTDTTVHIQYMEAGEEARRRRALDWLIERLISHFAESGLRYFDFGISTEDGGRLLNEGLTYQKEGFGGRTVCYDTYSVSLKQLLNDL